MTTDRSTTTSGLPPVLDRPVELLGLALLAVVAIGTVHLLIDLVAFTSDALGMIDGIVNDALLVIQGGLLLAAALFVVAGDEAWPAPLAPVRGAARGLLSPDAAMPAGATLVLGLTALHVVLRLVSSSGFDIWFTPAGILHDAALAMLVAGAIVGLVALRRSGPADDAMTFLGRALQVVAVAGGLAAVLGLIGSLIGDGSPDNALPGFLWTVAKVATAIAVLLSLIIVVGARTDTDTEPALGVLPEQVADVPKTLLLLGNTVLGLGVVQGLFRLRDGSGIDGLLYVVAREVRDVGMVFGIAGIAIVLALRTLGRADTADDGVARHAVDNAPMLIAVVAGAGALAGVLGMVVFTFGFTERLYVLANELLTSALGIAGIVIALAVLRARQAPTRPSADAVD